MFTRLLIRVTLSAGLVFGVALLPTAAQQAPTTPPPGSAERKGIMDAMRAMGDLHNLVFVVRYLKVQGDWAWATVDPQSADGNSHYETEAALLHADHNGWKVVDAPCVTDDCSYEAELARIRAAYPNAPGGIFPH